MRSKALWLLGTALVLALIGCGPQRPTLHEITPHEHHYPNTEVLGDYHLRLVVDHSSGELFLIFEDISEYPVRPVKNLERFTGTASLPDGSVKRLTFVPSEPLGHRFIRTRKFHQHARYAGLYMSQADWVKSAESFRLTVTVPFHGRDYELSYDYRSKASES